MSPTRADDGPEGLQAGPERPARGTSLGQLSPPEPPPSQTSPGAPPRLDPEDAPASSPASPALPPRAAPCEAPATRPAEPAPHTLETLRERAARYFAGARSPRTLRAYDGDWRRFCAWCQARGQAPYPAAPETIALYLTDLAERGRKISTVRRARAAIAAAHRRDPALAGRCPTRHPLVTDLMKGLARELAAPPERAPALSPEQLSAMLATLGTGRRALRDRALLTLGFAGAFRRSTLVALRVEDLRFVERGLEILVRADKADPAREGRTLPIAYAAAPERCAVRAVRAWLDASHKARGPLFVAVRRGGQLAERALSARSVDRVVKRAAAAAGLPRALSAHSLRAGFITSAIRQKHPLERIRVVSGHKEGSRAFEAYVRFADLWDEYAGEGVL